MESVTAWPMDDVMAGRAAQSCRSASQLFGAQVKTACPRADQITVNMTTVLPITATLVAAGLGALGSAGWTADARLLRRAEHALEIAAKTPARSVRVKLRESAHKDIERALELRRTRRPLAWVASATAGAAAVALLTPFWLAHHPNQATGWLGLVWVVLWLAYTLGTVAGLATVVFMLRARAPKE